MEMDGSPGIAELMLIASGSGFAPDKTPAMDRSVPKKTIGAVDRIIGQRRRFFGARGPNAMSKPKSKMERTSKKAVMTSASPIVSGFPGVGPKGNPLVREISHIIRTPTV